MLQRGRCNGTIATGLQSRFAESRSSLHGVLNALMPKRSPPPEDVHVAFPPGHFYSPIVAPAELDRNAIWPARVSLPAGVDFDDAGHRALLSGVFPKFLPDFDYPEHGAGDDELTHFYVRNSQFSWLDARAYFTLLRHWRPRRLIEVGSGYSTLLAADVNQRFLGGAMRITAIEPYPRPFLEKIPGIRVVRKPVQAVAAKIVDKLENGDVLFIDSTHVAKTGSDVNHLVFNVLPRLKAGVHVHFHDIFLPCEYPRDWVLVENRSWNEQYVVRALLMFSKRFEVVFGSTYAAMFKQAELARALGTRRIFGGGSLWLRVTDHH